MLNSQRSTLFQESLVLLALRISAMARYLHGLVANIRNPSLYTDDLAEPSHAGEALSAGGLLDLTRVCGARDADLSGFMPVFPLLSAEAVAANARLLDRCRQALQWSSLEHLAEYAGADADEAKQRQSHSSGADGKSAGADDSKSSAQSKPAAGRSSSRSPSPSASRGTADTAASTRAGAAGAGSAAGRATAASTAAAKRTAGRADSKSRSPAGSSGPGVGVAVRRSKTKGAAALASAPAKVARRAEQLGQMLPPELADAMRALREAFEAVCGICGLWSQQADPRAMHDRMMNLAPLVDTFLAKNELKVRVCVGSPSSR